MRAAVTAAVFAGVYWLSSARPAGEPIRAGLSLPDLQVSGEQLEPLLEPLRAVPFRLARVDVGGLERLDGRAVVASLALGDRPLIDVDPQEVCEHLRRAAPRIERCSAARRPPDRLMIEVTERHPVAVIATTGAGVDALGTVFPIEASEGKGLPRVSGELRLALSVLRNAHELGVPLDAVTAHASTDIAVRPRGTRAVLRLGSESERGLRRWLTLLRTISIAELRADEVDARFRGQVVLRQRGEQDGLGRAGGD
jgi:hypothetical protein